MTEWIAGEPPEKPYGRITDKSGDFISHEEAVKRARAYIVRYVSIDEIVDDYLEMADDDLIAQWIIDPETGLFGDE